MLEGVNCRVLTGVRMIGAGVNANVGSQCATETIVGKHTLNRECHGAGGVLLDHGLIALIFDAAGESAVTIVDLVGAFVTGQLGFFSVDDDDIVTTIKVGGKFGFVLTAQQVCGFSGNATEDFVFGIDNEPLLFYFAQFWDIRTHSLNLRRVWDRSG